MDESELREQLDEVNGQIERMRRDVAQLREEIGQGWDGPTDQAEQSSLLTNVEQQEALIDDLETRRQQILQRLGAA
ncbi:hypothetical protein JOL79_27075 [Microbispora sp. RL4-1S]|uniref:DUF342 domain-containing protein n=1 Tax=Microbispora oryzae TaxID=2806554 RepID=A0A940WM44_9ACTN|nr:hypothetical protein [Microbispora oryzae]MBP2707453.1 hypothetical protein [Microbispora oryzae]